MIQMIKNVTRLLVLEFVFYPIMGYQSYFRKVVVKINMFFIKKNLRMELKYNHYHDIFSKVYHTKIRLDRETDFS